MNKTYKITLGRDVNGNKLAKIRTEAGGFSVQTVGILPLTHGMNKDEIGFKGKQRLALAEICDYVENVGTKRQKRIIASLGSKEITLAKEEREQNRRQGEQDINRLHGYPHPPIRVDY